MSKYMLCDEDAINDINPFVSQDFSLPGGVRQTGNFDDFTKIREEAGIPEQKRSVYCDYGLCAKSDKAHSLSRPLYPIRNIDTGYTKNDSKFVERVVVGVANNAKFSVIGSVICTSFIALFLYHARR